MSTVVAAQPTAAIRQKVSPIHASGDGSDRRSAKTMTTPAKAAVSPATFMGVNRSPGRNRWAPSATKIGMV